tara:strand:- start:2219 stop:3388 length:1170 start_codon:yes stop_codon:yes gene_type:complete
MEFSEEELDILRRSNITPQELVADVMKGQQYLKTINTVMLDIPPEEVVARLDRLAEAVEGTTEIDQKYNQATEYIFNRAYKEITGQDPHNLDTKGFEKGVLQFQENMQDKDFVGAIPELDHMSPNEMYSRVDAAFKASFEAGKQDRILDEQYEDQFILQLQGEIASALVKNCEEESCNARDLEIKNLRELYERALGVEEEGIPPWEQKEVYDEFLGAYTKLTRSLYEETKEMGMAPDNGRYQNIKEALDKEIGIMPGVFPNKAIHYHELVAAEVKALCDEAIQNQDVFQKYGLYTDALEVMNHNEYQHVFKLDRELVGQMSGYYRDFIKIQQAEAYDELFPSPEITDQDTPEKVEVDAGAKNSGEPENTIQNDEPVTQPVTKAGTGMTA